MSGNHIGERRRGAAIVNGLKLHAGMLSNKTMFMCGADPIRRCRR